jgi:hypothetical protein
VGGRTFFTAESVESAEERPGDFFERHVRLDRGCTDLRQMARAGFRQSAAIVPLTTGVTDSAGACPRANRMWTPAQLSTLAHRPWAPRGQGRSDLRTAAAAPATRHSTGSAPVRSPVRINGYGQRPGAPSRRPAAGGFPPGRRAPQALPHLTQPDHANARGSIETKQKNHPIPGVDGAGTAGKTSALSALSAVKTKSEPPPTRDHRLSPHLTA